MPRIARLLRTGEQTVYHVMSRSALDGYPLGDVEKDYLVNLFKQLAGCILWKLSATAFSETTSTSW